VKAQPGARELLLALRKADVACVIATSSSEDELDALLKAADIADLIQTKSTSSDAEESKPAPDIIHAAMKKAKAKPEECVLVGDTRFDISAAEKAGVATVALRCGGSPEGDLLRAAAIYDDPAALSEAIRVS
jgi:HAD superfamily hydrolase (TIGR01509 family)